MKNTEKTNDTENTHTYTPNLNSGFGTKNFSNIAYSMQ